MTRTIKLYNRFHLGDHIINFVAFYHIKDYLEETDIHIQYYCPSEYHRQLAEFNCTDNVKIESIDAHDFSGFNMHIGNQELHNWVGNSYPMEFPGKMNLFLAAFLNESMQKVGIPRELTAFEYTDADLLTRYESINRRLDNKYAELDFLIFNSTAMSGQYHRNDDEWGHLIHRLNRKYKIATSEHVNGVICTQDDGLTVKDLAAVSTRAKKIIAVVSGPIVGLFNTHTLNNVEVIYTFAREDRFYHPKIVSGSDIKSIYFLGDE